MAAAGHPHPSGYRCLWTRGASGERGIVELLHHTLFLPQVNAVLACQRASTAFVRVARLTGMLPSRQPPASLPYFSDLAEVQL
jgi:hypothetical protein